MEQNMNMSFRRFLPLILAVVVVLLVSSFFTQWRSAKPDSSTYQGIFLTNGQVYFGKLELGSSEYHTLSDIYYLRQNPQQQPKEDEKPQPGLSLIKLGQEIHGPEDMMYIASDNVLFWENLKKDSKVVTAIAQEKAQSAQAAQPAPGTQNPAAAAPSQ